MRAASPCSTIGAEPPAGNWQALHLDSANQTVLPASSGRNALAIIKSVLHSLTEYKSDVVDCRRARGRFAIEHDPTYDISHAAIP